MYWVGLNKFIGICKSLEKLAGFSLGAIFHPKGDVPERGEEPTRLSVEGNVDRSFILESFRKVFEIGDAGTVGGGTASEWFPDERTNILGDWKTHISN